MRVECKLKNLKRTVSAGKNVNSISIYGEIRKGEEERLCTVNVNINNVSDARLEELAKTLGIEDVEAGVLSEFPIIVDIKVPQKTLLNTD